MTMTLRQNEHRPRYFVASRYTRENSIEYTLSLHNIAKASSPRINLISYGNNNHNANPDEDNQ